MVIKIFYTHTLTPCIFQDSRRNFQKNVCVGFCGVWSCLMSTNYNLLKTNINKVRNGIVLDNNDRVRADIFYKGYERNKYIWDVHLTEGKNREIKRIFAFFNVEVTSLHRYEFASIRLDKIKMGKYKLLKKNIINSVKVKYGYKK